MHAALPKPPFALKHGERTLLLGSCFAAEMGARLARDKFAVLCNPFGTLYNPLSIAAHLLRCVSQAECGSRSGELFRDEKRGQWLSWMHAEEFCGETRQALVARLDAAQEKTARWLQGCTTLVVTFGTSVVYRLRESGLLVSNCHKQADSLFTRERVAACDIVDTWLPTLQLLRSVCPGLRVVLTVSPVRHGRDGLHGNNLSKAELLLACDALCGEEGVSYFPAYELLMDELRDYRFYTSDMTHPTEQAADYIYERFEQTYIPIDERDLSARCRRVSRALQHRPFRPSHPERLRFLDSLRRDIDSLLSECPALDFTAELARIAASVSNPNAFSTDPIP